MTRYQFAGMVDIEELAPTTTREQVDQLIDDACENSFHSLRAPYCYHPYIVKKLKDLEKFGQIKLLGGGGFADGNWPTEVKLFSVAKCLEIGCGEIDLTSNIGWIKSGMWEEYREEIRRCRSLTRGVTLKVIIHAPQLSEEEIRSACLLLAEEGVDYVKTDTGRSPMPTTVEHVKVIRGIAGDQMKIKASGGIHTLETVLAMKEAGVDRIGMSRSSAMALFCQLPEN